jgi:vesicle-associated membrane protein 4
MYYSLPMADKKDKLYDVQIKVDETTTILKQNIDLAIKRGEDLEVLDNKAQNLEIEATRFAKLSKSVKNKFRCANCKMTMLIVGIVVVIVAIIIIAAVA